MNKSEFINYIAENCNISVEALRLIDNILFYAERLEDENAQCRFLCEMLDGAIGLSDNIIRKVYL